MQKDYIKLRRLSVTLSNVNAILRKLKTYYAQLNKLNTGYNLNNDLVRTGWHILSGIGEVMDNKPMAHVVTTMSHIIGHLFGWMMPKRVRNNLDGFTVQDYMNTFNRAEQALPLAREKELRNKILKLLSEASSEINNDYQNSLNNEMKYSSDISQYKQAESQIPLWDPYANAMVSRLENQSTKWFTKYKDSRKDSDILSKMLGNITAAHNAMLRTMQDDRQDWMQDRGAIINGITQAATLGGMAAMA